MTKFRAQFANPSGWMGRLVGHLLAWKNRERSEWVFSLLALTPAHRVLEVGFGPGADIERAGRVAAFVAGVDHSQEMVRMASRRNKAAIDAGRVELRQATADAIPFPDSSFDLVYTINTVQFARDPVPWFEEFRRVLRPGGTLVAAVQPRSKGADEQTATEMGWKLRDAAVAAGLAGVRLERRVMRPVSTVCLLAKRV